ncbi:unnamed protein product, partial [Mesorhabditis belari]|uniref:Protein transport protein Sec24B n=1 Tax=Mesorhabditis belari TaxID=2138241 RepID=A0AAF3FE45_9BILA
MSGPIYPNASRTGFPQAPMNGNYNMPSAFQQYSGTSSVAQIPPPSSFGVASSSYMGPTPSQIPSSQPQFNGISNQFPTANAYNPQPQQFNNPRPNPNPIANAGSVFPTFQPPINTTLPPTFDQPNHGQMIPASNPLPIPPSSGFPQTSIANNPSAFPNAPMQQPPTSVPYKSNGYASVPSVTSAATVGYNNANFHMQAQNTAQPAAQYSSYGQPATQMNNVQQGFQNMVVSGQSFDVVDVMAERHIIASGCEDIEYALPSTLANNEARMDSSVFRSTLNAIPQNEELLKKSRLPFGLTLHPFRDLKNLNVIQTSSIVRCRYCRTYINPYVNIPDNRHWKCNLCGRSNDLPDDFCWDPVTKSFGDPRMRPEVRNSTVEFIAPQEYTLRPPQECLYAFVLDISVPALESGYLHVLCEQLLINLDQLPGDERTLVCFIGVDSSIHFFQFDSPTRPPKQLIMDDIEEAFVPTNVGLLVNLHKYKETVRSFIKQLPSLFDVPKAPTQTGVFNCLGAALNILHEIIADIGGRISVFQCVLPSLGPGRLESREDPNNRAAEDVQNLGPASDFYKRLALECTGHQICLDLFLLNSQYADLATLSEIGKFSSGSVFHFPNFNYYNETLQTKRFERIISRYLTRKLGLEAVLRIRCSRGLAISTFYGNFFVRSTDLLSLANVNPDSAIAVQINYEEKLQGTFASFQAALLYTSSKGDRRIRVHTMCLPVVSDLTTVYANFDVKAATSLISKMGADRCLSGNPLTDAREATINAVVDALLAYRKSIGTGRPGIACPRAGHIRLFPLFALAMLKHTSFSSGRSVRLDDRAAAMLMLRFSPLEQILSEIYAQLYSLTDLKMLPEGEYPRSLPLSFEHVSRNGVYLLEAGTYTYIYVPQDADPVFLQEVFGASYHQLDDTRLKELDTDLSRKVHAFIRHISHLKFYLAPPTIVREDSPMREAFVRRLVEDRTDSSFSYHEFLKHIQQEIKG